MTAVMGPLGRRESHCMSKILRSRHTFFHHYFSCSPAALSSLPLRAGSQEILTRPGTHSKFGADGLREVFFAVGTRGVTNLFQTCLVKRQFDVLSLQDLVRRALDVEPSRRPTAAQVLSHPWMTAKDLADTRLTHDNPSLMKVSTFSS